MGFEVKKSLFYSYIYSPPKSPFSARAMSCIRPISDTDKYANKDL